MKAKSFGTGLFVGFLSAIAIAIVFTQFVRPDEVEVYGVQSTAIGGKPGMRVLAKNPAEGCDGYKLLASVSEQDEEAVVIEPSLSKLPSTGQCDLSLGGGPMSIETTVSLDAELGKRIVYVGSRDRENFVPKFGSDRDSSK